MWVIVNKENEGYCGHNLDGIPVFDSLTWSSNKIKCSNVTVTIYFEKETAEKIRNVLRIKNNVFGKIMTLEEWVG